MPSPRLTFSAVLLPNGHVVLIGGAKAGLMGDAARGGVAMANEPNLQPVMCAPADLRGRELPASPLLSRGASASRHLLRAREPWPLASMRDAHAHATFTCVPSTCHTRLQVQRFGARGQALLAAGAHHHPPHAAQHGRPHAQRHHPRRGLRPLRPLLDDRAGGPRLPLAHVVRRVPARGLQPALCARRAPPAHHPHRLARHALRRRVHHHVLGPRPTGAPRGGARARAVCLKSTEREEALLLASPGGGQCEPAPAQSVPAARACVCMPRRR